MDRTIKNYKHGQNGFTLIELLVVIVLLGFLSITGLSMFQGSQKRTRDSRRKTDLGQIAKALEMYANDNNGGYPSASSGSIVGCGTTASPTFCTWGNTWTKNTSTVYMQKLPKDPGSVSYCYQTVSKGYKLFAILEGDDADKVSPLVTCNGLQIYNYVLRSSNLLPTQ